MKHENYHEFRGDTEPFVRKPRQEKKPISIVGRSLAIVAGMGLLGAALKDGERYREKRQARLEQLEYELKDTKRIQMSDISPDDPDREELELRRKTINERMNELEKLRHETGQD